MNTRYRFSALLFVAIALAIQPVYAQDPAPLISELTIIDRDFMEDQRDSIDELAGINFGRQLRREKGNDLDILQMLLDRRLVTGDQSLQLQAMGIVMGDLLAEELDMDWVVYEDKLGRSRALRLGLSDHYLFPVTMISRRAEVGAEVDVRKIYDKAVSLMQPFMPPKPFQY
jgi:hypothetical protein